jgi:hypothetical protein
MGDATPRQQPLDAQETGETWDEANAEPEQEPQPESDPPPAGDGTQEQGPQSKFHG